MQAFSRIPSIRGPAKGPFRVFAALAGVLVRGPGYAATRAFDVMLTWQERAAQRHALRGMDDRGLADIGLTRADVEVEASKPFWQS